MLINYLRVSCLFFITLAILCFSLVEPVYALHPPTQAEIDKYKAEGTYNERLERVKKLGNSKINPYLLWQTNKKIERMYNKSLGKNNYGDLKNFLDENQVPDNWNGKLPSTGSPKVLVMLVDFPDYPHQISQTAEDVNNKFFGEGDSSLYPYDSLTKYYQRSSYGKLTIQGDVLDWYRAKHNRSYYEGLGDGGLEALIEEEFTYYESKGYNFSQYDNDGDGVLDAFYLKWTGPDTGWGGFWWAVQAVWQYDPNFTVSGKKLNFYVSSWYSNIEQEGTSDFVPLTDIHETGHLLGLPDYYDYEEEQGPPGGVGGLDMMDSNWGDHNCFSKFVLGWLEPKIISSGEDTITLRPSGTTEDSVIIMPNARNNPFGWEFYMAQYRKCSVGNDPGEDVSQLYKTYPNDGLIIWHVDTTLNFDGSTMYDNSTTDHKLLRLMEADGEEDIQYGETADAGDFYLPPITFGPDTSPNSHDYSGNDTFVSIDSLTSPVGTMSARFSLATETSIEFPAKQNVLPNKQWVIRFNQSVDVSTINAQNIYVLDNENKPVVDVEITPGSDNKSAIISPPVNGYQSGQTYVIFIKKDIKSTSGTQLKTSYKMKFTVL